MPWGEAHFGMGILIQQAACGNELGWPIIPAATLSIATHWSDDLNYDKLRIYHGEGKSWRKWPTRALRAPIWLTYAFIVWKNPALLLCGCLAWLTFDHQWALQRFWKGYPNLHTLMWPRWLKGELALTPWFILLALALVCVMHHYW
jgi:hypothetical protein